MKHIIMVLHSLAIGGAERRLSSVANYIAEQGHDVTVLLIDNPVVKFPMDPRVKVVCVNQSPDLTEYDPAKCELFRLKRPVVVSFLQRAKLKLMRLTRNRKLPREEMELMLRTTAAIPLHEYICQFPSAVVVSFLTIPNIVTMMATLKLPNRVLFGDCTDAQAEYPPESPFHYLRKKYYHRANGGIFQTHWQADQYKDWLDIHKYVIPNFIKSDQLPGCSDGQRRKEIVNFCHISGPKNIPLLIDAFQLLHQQCPDYHLIIYGNGPDEEKIKKKIQLLQLEQSVFLYDFDVHVHEKIRDAAMFVSSSDREGISNSMLEAMAIGLPCVCTDCAGGGARMMIEDHVNGLLVPMKDVNALYLAMKEVIEHPELAETLSRNAVKIKDRLRPEVICQQMLNKVKFVTIA